MLPRLHTFPRCPLMWIQVQRNLFFFLNLVRTVYPSLLFPSLSRNVLVSVSPRPSPSLFPSLPFISSSSLSTLDAGGKRSSRGRWPASRPRHSPAAPRVAVVRHRESSTCPSSSLLLPFLPNSKYQRAEEGEALSDLSVAKVTFLSAARQFDGLHCRKAFDALSSVFCNAVRKELI